MDIVLVHPEIPHNTGCAGRLAAATGVPLHLVEPLGFSLDDRYLKRAGLDYWPLVPLSVHADWSALTAALGGADLLASRMRLFSARGGESLFDVSFACDDVLVFGCESTGLPRELLEQHSDRKVYVPVRSGVRSLNLANTVCLATYTALHRSGAGLPDNDGSYAPDPRSNEGVRPREVARVQSPQPRKPRSLPGPPS